MTPTCVFPRCPRRDLADGLPLCLGHALLWQRSSYYFAAMPRPEAMAEWIAVTSVGKPTHGNGVPP
jgi:hypothetical protein